MAPLCEGLLLLEVWLSLMLLEPLLVLLDLMLAQFKAQARYLQFCSDCLRVFFLLEQLRIRTDSLVSVCQGVYDTKPDSQVFLKPEDAMLKTWRKIVLSQQISVYRE